MNKSKKKRAKDSVDFPQNCFDLLKDCPLETELSDRLSKTAKLIHIFFEGLLERQIIDKAIIEDLKYLVFDYIDNLGSIALHSQLFDGEEMSLRFDEDEENNLIYTY